jgi:hypothetical protein
MVLSNGRNLSPEWLEAAVLSDPLFSAAKATGQGRARPHLTLVVRPQILGQLLESSRNAIQQRLEACLLDLPAHAWPEEVELRYGAQSPSLMTLRFDPADGLRPVANF